MVFNAFPLRAIVENYLLQVTLESLSEAEWKTHSEPRDPFEKTDELKIATPVGLVEISVPNDRGAPFHSKLLRGKKLELYTPVASILQLSFCEGPALEAALKGIYQEELPETFLSIFSNSLSKALQKTQTANLPAEFDTLYFGSLSFDEQDAQTSARALDYCVGVSEDNERHVLGLWDPGKRWLSRWREIRLELERRGLREARGIITDNSPGLADVLLGLLPPGKEIETPIMAEELPAIEIAAPEAEVQVIEETVPEEEPEVDLFESEEVDRQTQPVVTAESASGMSALLSVLSVTILILLGGFYFSILGRSIEKRTAELAPSQEVIQFDQQQKSEMIERRLLADLVDVALPPETLSAAVENASLTENPSVKGAIIRLGSHPNSLVRISVAKALSSPAMANILDSRIELVRLLNDDDFLVRGFAAKSLSRMQEPQARDILRQHLSVEQDQHVKQVIEKILQDDDKRASATF